MPYSSRVSRKIVAIINGVHAPGSPVMMRSLALISNLSDRLV
ncbi:hypothetical protein [Nostoc sp. UHCC 0252]|nr:hypothetical protein [Nostoc sp. UHCC 0252]MEA5604951.1 hypothetical protein [Nostoc sp. UHCC 0252]